MSSDFGPNGLAAGIFHPYLHVVITKYSRIGLRLRTLAQDFGHILVRSTSANSKVKVKIIKDEEEQVRTKFILALNFHAFHDQTSAVHQTHICTHCTAFVDHHVCVICVSAGDLDRLVSRENRRRNKHQQQQYQ